MDLLGLSLAIIFGAFVLAAVVGMIPQALWDRFRGRQDIDLWLSERVADQGGAGGLKALHPYLKGLPAFRLADLHRALDRLGAEADALACLDSTHPVDLAQVLSGRFHADRDRQVRPPASLARPVGEGEDTYVPADTFRVLRREAGAAPLVLRLRFLEYNQHAILEVAGADRAAAEAALTDWLRLAGEASVYRGKTLEVSFEAEVRDEYGDTVQGELIDLRFRPTYRVGEDAIILDPDQRALLDRLLVDFHARRAALRRLGLPSRRGVLFYGPPGTGKTHTCKYLADRLDGVTTLVATGRALLHARSICQIARMLQPALVVLEDVDLVYGQREESAYGVALGELMDELDGFARDDEILFVLTTNAIDRVEAAVKDRPGRISQCVLFDLPGPDLRRRYLSALLAPYDTSALDLGAAVALTERTSQAFLKELVFRTVQVATEADTPADPADVRLSLEDLRRALDEMKAGAGREGAAILGFQLA